MVTSLAAVGAKKIPKPSSDNAMGYLIAGVVGIWLLKSAADLVWDPLQEIGSAIKTGTVAVVNVGDELTGGIQGDPSSIRYWTEVDVPFSDTQIPLVNIKEEDQSWIDYATTVDLPVLPEYNLQDAPGQIKGLFGRIF
jgi:hypothetical protein|tara:strand:- start:727 stop:1140 length:414 start_codon:yes stop_codon:yes gene_type:complete